MVRSRIIDIRINDRYILCTREAQDSLEYYVISIPEFIENSEGLGPNYFRYNKGKYGPMAEEEYQHLIYSLGIDINQMSTQELR